MITDEMVLAGAKTTNPLAWEMTDGKYIVSDITREETLNEVRRILTAALAATPADVLERIARERFSDPATDDLTVPLTIELSEMTMRAFKAEDALRAAAPAVGGEIMRDKLAELQNAGVKSLTINQIVGLLGFSETEAALAPPASPLRGVTDEMVERAWAAIVGGDIAKECSHANIIRADLKTGLSAALAPAVGGEALTLELDDASNACLELCSKHGFATGHGDTVADMIREIDGQIAPPASPLRGRELDWQEVVADRGDGSNEISGYEADSGFGPWYYIDIYFGSDSLGWDVSYDSTQLGDTDDPDTAKQLAQSDFEKRVLGAVSTSPPEQPEETP